MKTNVESINVSDTTIIKLNNSLIHRTFKNYSIHKYLMLIFLPVAVYYIIFHYIPMYGVIIAFKDYNFTDGIFGSPWVGLEYFKQMFSGETFLEVFFNTIIISAYKLIFGFPAPIILALLFNEIRNAKFKKFTQTVSYLPYFLSWVVLGGIVIQLLSPSIGPIGYVMKSLGLKPINFLADPKWFRSALVATSVWKSVGWGSIIYLAAITGIDQEQYEAAIMDGANRLERMLHITLPGLIPVITIMFILNVGNIISDDFDQIFNLYNPAVYETGDVISTYVYRVGLISMKYSYGTAVGLFRNVIAMILVISTNTIVKRTNEYSLW